MVRPSIFFFFYLDYIILVALGKSVYLFLFAFNKFDISLVSVFVTGRIGRINFLKLKAYSGDRLRFMLNPL